MKAADELLDVVDVDDRVVTQMRRAEIHARGLMHRAVHVLVFNSDGELFLQKRSMSKDENPGLWDSSAAGHVDAGEDYLDCARRELGEELGIDAVDGLEFLFKLDACADTGFEHSKIYRLVYDGPMALQQSEIDGGKWVSPQRLGEWLASADGQLTATLALIWQAYLQSSASPG